MKIYGAVDTENCPVWNYTEQWILKTGLYETLQNSGYK